MAAEKQLELHLVALGLALRVGLAPVHRARRGPGPEGLAALFALELAVPANVVVAAPLVLLDLLLAYVDQLSRQLLLPIHYLTLSPRPFDLNAAVLVDMGVEFGPGHRVAAADAHRGQGAHDEARLGVPALQQRADVVNEQVFIWLELHVRRNAA